MICYLPAGGETHLKLYREKATDRNGFDLLRTVHESEVEKLKLVAPAHRFEVTLEPDTFTDEKYLLYKTYQVNVHHDKPSEVSQAGFKRFLCSSPLGRCIRQKNAKDQQLGSYHQCYRLDGRLIAVGVLDLLPHAVSGVYFMYHEDFEKWSFGKLSAMHEAALALEGGYEFYYMGFYIHNCVKMRYKGDYKPQYVLDPESYEWNPLDETLRGMLDQKKYVSLSRQRARASETASPSGSQTDGEAEYPLPLPKQAADSGLSLIQLGMPGIPKAEELERQIDLDTMKIFLGQGKGMMVKTSVSAISSLICCGVLTCRRRTL